MSERQEDGSKKSHGEDLPGGEKLKDLKVERKEPEATPMDSPSMMFFGSSLDDAVSRDENDAQTTSKPGAEAPELEDGFPDEPAGGVPIDSPSMMFFGSSLDDAASFDEKDAQAAPQAPSPPDGEQRRLEEQQQLEEDEPSQPSFFSSLLRSIKRLFGRGRS